MIRRIILQNYMSHALTVIEPAAGLTVLVGPNNCGKSAVVAALETLCTNASGAYMVRHDEKEVRVTIETDDGHTCVWRRRGNVVSYIIDGNEIHRLKGGLPDDLHKVLRLPKVQAGENAEPFAIHFGTQKSPIFLLNEPESRAALFFASSSDAAILLEMQKRHRNKVKERKNDEKRLKGEMGRLDAELAALEPLNALAASVAQAEGQYQELLEFQGQIGTLDRDIEALYSLSVRHTWLEREYQSLAPLKAPPPLVDTDALDLLMDELLDAELRLQHSGKLCAILQNLASPPELDDIAGRSSTIRFLADAEQNVCRWSDCWTAVKDLMTPPALENADQLNSLGRALSHAEENRHLLKAKAACLGPLKDAPIIAESGQHHPNQAQ